MRAVLRFAFLFALLIAGSGCVSFNNLREGIYSFRIQDYRQAFVRLLPEAKRGNPSAQYAVGYMYYYGQGVVENRKKAWIWINRAALAGDPDAIRAQNILNIAHVVKPAVSNHKILP